MWLDTYFKGCDFTGTGVKEFVSICNTVVKIEKIEKMKKWEPKWEPIPLPGERIVDIEKIGDLAAADMDRHDLYNDKAFSSALKNAKPSRSVLVQRLDLPDSYYYMVPMKSEKAVTAMVLADGMNGSLQGCTAFKAPLKRPFLSQEQALERVLDKTIDLGNKAGTIKFREGTFSSHPVLVWKPCRESLSPYYPFHMFTSGDKHVYVGHNGRIFTELHDKGPVG